MKHHIAIYNNKQVKVEDEDPKAEFKYAAMRIHDNLGTGPTPTDVGYVVTPKGSVYMVSRSFGRAKPVTGKEAEEILAMIKPELKEDVAVGSGTAVVTGDIARLGTALDLGHPSTAIKRPKPSAEKSFKVLKPKKNEDGKTTNGGKLKIVPRANDINAKTGIKGKVDKYDSAELDVITAGIKQEFDGYKIISEDDGEVVVDTIDDLAQDTIGEPLDTVKVEVNPEEQSEVMCSKKQMDIVMDIAYRLKEIKQNIDEIEYKLTLFKME